ncbi:fungal-specific transcription factor domain-containing protein [Halenospora varia]|nr:fungal-specific transcription factor domain-containing protein [Halenospora varia]
MATTVVNASRSLYGCWTCRLRKKKCDENRPSCYTCTSLELYCHGFGPRPEWMDRGLLQKQKALEVKQILRHIKSNKYQRQSIQTAQHMRLQLDPVPVKEASSSNLIESSPIHGTSVVHGSATPQDNLHNDIVVRDLTTFDVPMWGEPSCNNILPEESFFNQEDVISASNQNLFAGNTGIENVDFESNSASSGLPERVSASAPVSLSGCEGKTRWGNGFSRGDSQLEANLAALVTFSGETLNASIHESDLSRYLTSKNQDKSSPLIQQNSASTSVYFGCHDSWFAGSSSSILCRNTEDTLFMHYLDEVFYIQYPFYDSSKGGRGWLFSILRRVKSAYYAALALSEHYRHSTLSQHNNIASSPVLLRAKNRYYDLALQEMQLSLAQSSMWSGTTVIIRSIETLTSILQLLYWELFRGGTENWQIHLRAASTLIPALVRLVQMASIAQVPINSGRRNEQQHKKLLHSEDDSAIRFLLGSFISMDIISCASTRSSPFLELDHKLILERAGIELENLNGCKNWIMVLTFEISQLDTWRRKADKTQSLSLRDLVKRGGQIEERLQEKLANIENEPSIGVSIGNTSGIVSMSASTEITKIFALSATTYLHVVISGAHPELPEVKGSVSKTIAAFKRLTDAKLLRHLVWPFCISGCLALEEEHAFFRDLISAAELTQLAIGTCLEALKIMEECWRMRKSGSSNCDWVSVMNRCGRYVLLG